MLSNKETKRNQTDWVGWKIMGLRPYFFRKSMQLLLEKLVFTQ